MRPPRAMAHLGAGILLAVVHVGPAPGQEAAGFRPTDLYRVVEAGQPRAAPTGGMVAFTVRRPRAGTDRVHREVWVQELEDGAPEGSPVRFSDPTEDSHTPRWSPDGSLLSFVSRRGDDPNPIWFLRLDGPGGEAFHLPGVEGPPIWSPDGEWIAYLKPEPPSPDSPAALTRAPEEDRFDGTVVTHLPFRDPESGAFLPPPEERPRRQLFVVPADGGLPRPMTRVGWDITEVVWGGDGEGLYFVGDPSQDEPASTAPTRSLWHVSLERGRVHRITSNPGGEWAPAISPDGERIAFLDMETAGSQVELRVAELGRSGDITGEVTTVTADFDRDAGRPTWSPDGGSLFFLARDGGRRSLYRIGARGGSLTRVVPGARTVAEVSFSRDASVLAFTASSPTRPRELYVAEGDGSDEERVTDLNGALLEERELASPSRLTWRADDGSRIEGWVVEPVEFRPGTSYPLTVVLGDGPHGAVGDEFLPVVQALSAAGNFVLYGNPRGSAGYGHDFRTANRGQWGIVEKEDVLAGVDAALARFPEIDPERLGVTGEGYGGFLAAWLTATSDRFRAAVPVRMVSSWESWYGTSSARRLAERGLSGPPWRRRSRYRRVSPLSYVENVIAPTLLLHDRGDARMPATESEQWFTALRRKGVESELVLYPPEARAETGALGPRARVDGLDRTLQWFRRWLGTGSTGDRVSENRRDR